MLSSLQRLVRNGCDVLYGVYAVLAFLVLALVCLLIILLPLGIGARRAITHAFARALFLVLGVRITVKDAQSLPDGPCVVVANHASYLDGIVLKAALPSRFSFVIKKEVSQVPLGGLLLRRIGSEFIERFNRHAAATDARRLMKVAESGQALVFFPEGTFAQRPGVGKFHSGAFAVAVRTSLPVVPVALQGTRWMLPSGRLLPRPGRVAVLIQAPIGPFATLTAPEAISAVRDEARARILAVVEEPDLMAS